ncbi:MAG: hypothetical protein CVU09_00855 [Bacteroidetes bacterium HGW-Bacteroidetes-4]|jgi:hypothetical protein|nr:MAG: hypothetical protein CVU09_00855 [Bacteroidetes bacterium HGW-Bacteroidetes-4]
MRKSIVILLSFIMINQYATAQVNAPKLLNGKIGLTFSSFGENQVFRFSEYDGAPGYESDYFRTLGISWIYPVNAWLEFETGVEFAEHHITINPTLPPDLENTSRPANFSLINVPFSLRANFLKYFFMNGGLILDIDASTSSSIDNQTGIGTLLGFAAKYDFSFGLTAFVNPYFKVHSIMPFQDSDHHQRVWENGVRLGLTYDFGK